MDNDNLVNKQIASDILFVVALLTSIYILNKRKKESITPASIYTIKISYIIIYFFIMIIAYEAYRESKHKIDLVALIATAIAIIPPITMFLLSVITEKENITGFRNPVI